MTDLEEIQSLQLILQLLSSQHQFHWMLSSYIHQLKYHQDVLFCTVVFDTHHSVGLYHLGQVVHHLENDNFLCHIKS